MLEEAQDYEKYYSKDDQEGGEKKPISSDEREVIFYNNDLEFMRHHKRTKRNMEEVLNGILASNNQKIQSGALLGNHVYVESTRLNKSCSLLHVFWNLG